MMPTVTHNAPDIIPERVLFMAVAVRETTWKRGCTTGHGQQPRERPVTARHQAGVRQAIAQAKRRCGLPATVPVVSCDDAGRAGCWLQRFFQAHGLTNSVIDSASLAGNRRQRRAKSDALAVRKLLHMRLRDTHGDRDGWRVVQVPSVDAEGQRQLHRAWETCKQERARTTTRSKGVLSRQGVRLTSLRKLPEPLEALRLGHGSPLPRGLRRRVLQVYAPQEGLSQQLAELDAARRALRHSAQGASIAQVRQLLSRKGSGITGAGWLVRECWAGVTSSIVGRWRAERVERPRRITAASVRGNKASPSRGSGTCAGCPRSWRRYQAERALSGGFRARLGGGGGGAAAAYGAVALPGDRSHTRGCGTQRGIRSVAARSDPAALVLVEAAR